MIKIQYVENKENMTKAFYECLFDDDFLKLKLCNVYAILFIQKKTGNNLFSQQGNPQVSSAHWSLTSVFGMGTGISSM